MQNRRAGRALAADDVTIEEMAGLMEHRAETYRFLSRLFQVEVDEALLSRMRGMLFPARSGNGSMDMGYRQIARYLGSGEANLLVELAVDYVRCFIGHGQNTHCAAYPYESVYTNKRRLMMQDARDSVLAVYRSEGLDRATTWKVPEDHIALELEFMGTLADRTASALREGDQAEARRLLGVQRAFAEDHLYKWAPLLAADMDTYAKTEFYRGLANLLTGFVEVDAAFLKSA